jgi:hydroxymethylpyrimidine kinase/phosphomethylpyrimidine kinase
MPLAAVVTPNIPEAMRFTGLSEPRGLDDLSAMAQAMMAQGARAVLVKGGHMEGAEASDVLFDAQGQHVFTQPRIATTNTHGTGCTLSSAIAAQLASGASLPDAVARAKAYLTQALRSATQLDVGHGHGPVNHMWPLLNAE